MKEFIYENQGTNTYLVYSISQNESVDTMSLGMLTNNKIPGLAPAIFMQMNNDVFIKYNVSAHISVKQIFMGPVNKKRLIGVFSGIVDAMISADDYMIDVSTILLDLEYIFADVSTFDTVLICLPLLNEGVGMTDLGAFFKNIMFNTQFDQTENCDHVAKIMNYLNSTPIFSLHDFKALIETLRDDNRTEAPPQQSASAIGQGEARQQPVVQTQQPVVQREKSVEQASAISQSKTPTASQQNEQKKPAQQFKVPQSQQPQKPAEVSEKKMTMLNLLMHYNKENAALYRAQKNAEKAGTTKENSKQPKQKQGTASSTNFAVPGTQSAVETASKHAAPDFMIPGQQVQIGSGASGATSTNTCSNCGSSLKANATFCSSCGARCGATSSQQQVAQQQPIHQVAPSAEKPSQGMPLNFGETTVLGGGIGETTVLDGGMPVNQPDPHLLRAKNNEKIPLNKPVFRIGKERSYVDYFISDNTAISRSHANIINHNGEFVIVDTNSTNHTYVNGTMIPSGQETKLAHGDKIRLANEDFEFRLY